MFGGLLLFSLFFFIEQEYPAKCADFIPFPSPTLFFVEELLAIIGPPIVTRSYSEKPVNQKH